MPRKRTESAIRKAERTQSVKEEIHSRKAKRASQRYRLRLIFFSFIYVFWAPSFSSTGHTHYLGIRNKERLNEEAKNRMGK